MKKVISVLLVLVMLIGVLAGCGGASEDNADTKATVNNNETVSNDTPADKDAAVGDVLDAPEVAFDEDEEDLYVYFMYPGDTEEEVLSMEITMKQIDPDTYVMHVTDGLLKVNEILYEVSDSGITKYYKDAFMEGFVQETELSQSQLEAERDGVLELLAYFLMAHPDYEGLQYRKSDAFVAVATGDTYVYDLIENGEVAGQIAIDKATGLMVSFRDADNNMLFTVSKLATGNVEIPSYK